ncbi:hypothetical protein [Amycolatopsis sp. FDAARGOS 1241]|uniref:hypothetical protein n=1 Tax=Amycolatopsis sp. FDAARGOS 1241 TaxID=2778070 RepID=UPI0019511306|nr:hypothetical protein [Amycolatopsis sp. FDAARGOS 1241]QRP44740.1 hypothetical protein I6J71_36755 [Amycolatopsis sp. FDAARGOS 1241]
MLDEAPTHDVADQQRPARPEPFDDEQVPRGIGDSLDADPADVADQHRDAPVIDDGEPWP